jgi:hypothetical protein
VGWTQETRSYYSRKTLHCGPASRRDQDISKSHKRNKTKKNSKNSRLNKIINCPLKHDSCGTRCGLDSGDSELLFSPLVNSIVDQPVGEIRIFQKVIRETKQKRTVRTVRTITAEQFTHTLSRSSSLAQKRISSLPRVQTSRHAKRPWRRFSAPGRLSIVDQPVGEIRIFQKVIRETKQKGWTQETRSYYFLPLSTLCYCSYCSYCSFLFCFSGGLGIEVFGYRSTYIV